jgi:hypothetical protein
MAPDGNIYFGSEMRYTEDFSKEDLSYQGRFIHEMTHVWQHQRGIFVIFRGIFGPQYEYLPFDPQLQFLDHNIEQQGNIVRDYFLLREGQSVPGAPDLSVYEKLIPFVD